MTVVLTGCSGFGRLGCPNLCAAVDKLWTCAILAAAQAGKKARGQLLCFSLGLGDPALHRLTDVMYRMARVSSLLLHLGAGPCAVPHWAVQRHGVSVLCF